MTCCTDENIFTWQLEVQINNFKTYQISSHLNVLILYEGNTYNPKFDVLKSKYTEVKFFFYKDDDTKKYIYPPFAVPRVLKKHFENFPYLSQRTIFLYDTDIIFTKQPTFDHLLKDENWYVGDCKSYIGSEYIKSKGEYIFSHMCKIVHIDESLVVRNENNSGGAQYILKNVTYQYWEKVEQDSFNLFQYLKTVNENDLDLKRKNTDIQQWCASMWAILWNGWLLNHEIRIDDSLNFCMSTSSIKDWEKYAIYHDAGATKSRRNELFYKNDFREILPYNLNFNYLSKQYCSYNYVCEIQKTELISCLI